MQDGQVVEVLPVAIKTVLKTAPANSALRSFFSFEKLTWL
jgi:hypothetical protein